MEIDDSRVAVRTPAPACPSRRGEPAIVRAAQRGSEEAIEQIFREHWPASHRAAFLIVRDSAAAEDIAQEAFLAVLRVGKD